MSQGYTPQGAVQKSESSVEFEPHVNETIALLQFHDHFELCRSRIDHLRLLNPALKIFGLFGGEADALSEARNLEAHGLVHVYHDPTVSAAWNKKNTDLAVRNWYKGVGRFEQFERVHVIQWDLLFFAPLNVVYPKIPHDAIALSGLIHLDEIADVWAWTVDAHLSTESEQLLQLAKTALGYRGRPYACIGPGYSLSRTFLERFSAIDVVDIGHDELRVPLFAQLLGIEIVDTGFAPLWTEPAVEAVFNADANEIDPLVVERELLHGNRRVFHPCRERFDRLSLKRLVAGMSPTD